MIGFKLGYIFEQAIPTNLGVILCAWSFIEFISRHIETKYSRLHLTEAYFK